MSDEKRFARPAGRLLLTLALGCAFMPVAQAQSDTRQFYQIPAQTLDAALVAWSRASGIPLFASARLTQGLVSAGLQGDYEAMQALQALLQGTGLRARVLDQGQIALEPDTLELNATHVSHDRWFPGSREDAVYVDPTRTVTSIGASELARTQPATIFDAVSRIPGVAIEGGPRPSGMTFNIRGYTDSEDVQVRVDNVPKSFEKYRFGGTFVEPELLKSIEVQRGPLISSGSGSLGGTVLAVTKDAADLLGEGRRYGARMKFGYVDNNDEFQRSYTGYARPVDWLDVLYNQVLRDSNDITHSDDSPLEQSAIQSRSQLFKLSLFPIEGLKLTTSAVLFKDRGLQPYDATGSDPGFFGNVIRDVEDWSLSETIHWTPGHDWIDLTATVGKGHTKMRDLSPPGFKRNSSGTANDYEDRKFSSSMLDIANTMRLHEADSVSLSLLTGLQFNKIDRKLQRRSDKPGHYPADGFWANGISGSREYWAAYAQPRLRLGAVEIVPGIRVDRYEVEADEIRVKNHLAQTGRSSSIDFSHETYSLGLSYDLLPERLTLFGNYAEGFRPPSVDEYFSYGENAGAQSSIPAWWPPFLPWTSPLGLGGDYAGGEGRCNTLATNFICGDVYKLQTSTSSEIGLNYRNPQLWIDDLQVFAKYTYLQIRTDHLLQTLRIDPINQRYGSQNGRETRYGHEMEGGFNYQAWYGRINYSRMWGRYNDGAGGALPIYTIPGNTLNLTLGYQVNASLGLDISYRKVDERDVIPSGGGNQLTVQDGYETLGAGVHWSARNWLTLRLIGENLANNDYHLNAGGMFAGYQGNRAPGRTLRFVSEFIF